MNGTIFKYVATLRARQLIQHTVLTRLSTPSEHLNPDCRYISKQVEIVFYL